MHKDYLHDLPLYIKMAPLNIEVALTLIEFEQLFSSGKSKIKLERTNQEKRHLIEFDFVTKFVETMSNMLSKEEDRKKSVQEFQTARLRELLLDLVKNLETPFEHLKSLREVVIVKNCYIFEPHPAFNQLFQHFFHQSCEFTAEHIDPSTRDNMSAVKVKLPLPPYCS
jgi:hypothetical protein